MDISTASVQISVWMSIQTCGSWRSNDVSTNLPGHLLQRGELLFVDQLELGDEVVEVLVAGIHVGLRSYRHDPIEVMDIDVHKYSVETREDLLALWLEGLRSR